MSAPRIGASILVGVVLLLAQPALAQDPAPPPQPAHDDLEFRFKGADLLAVMEYISRKCGYVFVNQAQVQGTVEAVSAQPIPKARALEFFNSVLDPLGAVALPNAHNPRVVEIVSKDEAKRKNIPIRVGADPNSVLPGDRVLIQIVPLRSLDVATFDRELKGILPKTAEVTKDTASNSLILTDTGDSIKRFLDLLLRLETIPHEKLSFKVIELKNAESSDVSRVVQEFVRKESSGAPGGGRAFSWEKAWFGNLPEKSRGPTADYMRVIAEPKGNFVVLVGTEDNIRLLEGLVTQIDQRAAAVAQVKVYRLRSSDSRELSQTVTQLFRPESPGPKGNPPRHLQWWDPAAAAQAVAAYPIKALADPKTNSLMVTATPEQIALIDRIVASFDVSTSTKMYQLRFADAKQTADFVAQMHKGQQFPEVKALAESRTNTLVVTATDEQLAVVDQLISEMDRQIQDSLKIKIFTIKNAAAEDVASTIGQVLKPTPGAGGVSIRPVETHVIKSTNSIVVRGPDEYFKLVEEVIAHHEATPREERVTFVVKLKSASATSVQEILKAAAAGRGPLEFGEGFSPAMPPLPKREREPYSPPPEPPKNLGGPQDPPKPAPGRAQVPQDIEIQANEESNTLIVRASARHVEELKRIIAELDRYRPQVLIRVLIAEVTLDKDLQYGVEAFIENRLRLPGGSRGAHSARTAFGLPVSGFAYILSAAEFESSLRAFAEDGKLNVMATPRVLALDNQPATLSTGKRVPFITSSRQTPEGSVLNSIQYQEVGIILKVTPRITADGLVTMYVRPEVSDTTSATESVTIAPGVNAPTFSSNYAETTVTVKNGQTVILGGLIREFDDEVVSKVPVLGDIPIIGMLFSKTAKAKQRRELMIFITPQVVFSAGQLEELTAIERGKLRLIDQSRIDSEVKSWLRDAR